MAVKRDEAVIKHVINAFCIIQIPDTGIGFKDGTDFTAAGVEKAVSTGFPREFRNRIDRIIVFKPLGINVMRQLLHKELNEVLQRRGLRNRNWQIEWDETALNFLLEKGFTKDLGARPLKRAVERYLLSPLALTIVNHQFPEGDQFLFVRGDKQGIKVEFIDPNVPEKEATELIKESETIPEQEGRIEKIILDPLGTVKEVEFLKSHYDVFSSLVKEDGWQERKQNALARMSSPEFWQSEDRFSLLGQTEYMDRIEAGIRTAGSLLDRLVGQGGDKRKQFPQNLVKRLAQQLYLLDAAYTSFIDGQPRDAFLLVEAGPDDREKAQLNNEFARQLRQMYINWAELRHMRLKVLEDSNTDAEPYRFLCAVSGYAAFTILAPESGLHVLEIPSEKKTNLRCKIRVRVVSQPDVRNRAQGDRRSGHGSGDRRNHGRTESPRAGGGEYRDRQLPPRGGTGGLAGSTARMRR
jgi:ATP-dependent Clp protease ATP-binding subunit ClpC